VFGAVTKHHSFTSAVPTHPMRFTTTTIDYASNPLKAGPWTARNMNKRFSVVLSVLFASGLTAQRAFEHSGRVVYEDPEETA
jgi:hypothetical protein